MLPERLPVHADIPPRTDDKFSCHAQHEQDQAANHRRAAGGGEDQAGDRGLSGDRWRMKAEANESGSNESRSKKIDEKKSLEKLIFRPLFSLQITGAAGRN